MKFFNDNGIYKVSRISGPLHNYLGLVFSDVPVADVDVVAIKLDAKEPERLRSKEVLKQVLAAAEHSSRVLSRPYNIKKVEFVSGDSLPEEIYFQLTQAIIERLHTEGESF
ncbi:hypothetical protein EBQ34_09730 [Vandammella animalimorsus]|uniref:Uncharacterized protein n=1 Tax=Vandammella animalimorsus TaxID=2029117 RepID=A0A3M6R9W0_9BURK|nr:hypothetical protein [Vandammella animalimorsus]RMX11839.1 hypothetical protein EBQ34_09730 [Vandammella animalimorsus]